MSAEAKSAEPLVIVAHAVKTKGLKGEIVTDLLTDFPERFQTTSRLVAVFANGKRTVLEIESHRLQIKRAVFKFAGVDTIESAAELVGADFAVPESEKFPLPAGHFYDWEIEGFDVETVSGEKIGRVEAVIRGGGSDTLRIVGSAKRDFLVPMVESIVREIDVKRRLVVIDPPEGLLEL